MSPGVQLPRLSRFAFYQSGDDGLVHEIAKAVYEHAQQHPSLEIPDRTFQLYVWSKVTNNVPNGGFAQFFYNHRGDSGVEGLCELLTELGLPEVGGQLTEAVGIYRRYRGAVWIGEPVGASFREDSGVRPARSSF